MAWRYSKDKKFLWAQVLHKKYDTKYKLTNRTYKKERGSHIWKNIVEGTEICNKGMQWITGDGKAINIWDDKWINNAEPLRSLIQGPLTRNGENLNLSSIIANGAINLNTISFDLPNGIKQKVHNTYIKQGRPSRDKPS